MFVFKGPCNVLKPPEHCTVWFIGWTLNVQNQKASTILP